MNNPINIQFLSGIHNGGRPTTPGSKTATARSTATPSRSFYLDVGTTLTLVGLTCEAWSGTAWVAIATGEDLTYSKVRVTATSSADWDTLLSPTINTLVYSLRTPVDPATIIEYIDEMLQSELDGMLQSEIDALLQTRP